MRVKRGNSAEFALKPDQVQVALKVCHDLIDRLIIKLGVYLGLRVGEMVHMNEDWITLQGTLRIPRVQKCNCASCMRNPKHPGEWWSKTPASAATLPIPEPVKKDLIELLRVQPYGLGITREAIWYRTKNILTRANIKFKRTARNTGFTHCLRATCASLLAAGGMNAFEIAVFLRWKDSNMAKVYVDMMQVKPHAFKQVKAILG